MSEFIVGQIYEFHNDNKRPDGTIDPFILNGVFKCTTVEEDGKPYFKKIRSHPPKLTLADIDVSRGVCDDSGFRHFPDGSIRQKTGYVQNPPDDPLRRQKKIVYFWKMRLGLALDEFQSCKQNLLNWTTTSRRTGHPPPHAEAIDKLQLIKAKVDVLNEKLEEEESKLSELEGERTLKNAYEEDTEEVANIIKSIEV